MQLSSGSSQPHTRENTVDHTITDRSKIHTVTWRAWTASSHALLPAGNVYGLTKSHTACWRPAFLLGPSAGEQVQSPSLHCLGCHNLSTGSLQVLKPIGSKRQAPCSEVIDSLSLCAGSLWATRCLAC